MSQVASPIVAQLERAYAELRRRHTDLPERVVFLLGSGSMRGGIKYGHFHDGQWAYRIPGTRDKPVSIPEVLISGECLAEGGAQVMQTLIHEAAHALAAARGLKDTSRQGRWHNKTFVKVAEEVGLEHKGERPDPRIGWSFVTMTEETEKRYAKQIAKLDEVIAVAKDAGLLATEETEAPVRTVAVVVFKDGTEIELGMKTYEKVSDYLVEHEMHEEER